MRRSKFTRRRFLQTSAAAATATIAMPYMRTSYSAGKVTLGLWDHWVPGANDTMSAIVKEWGEKNHVETQIDYITSVGDKDLLTASAEAQAKTGHDIMQHRAWQVTVHRAALEPVSDVIDQLIKEHGAIAESVQYLARHDGKWMGIPTIVGSQVKPACSRIDLYKKFCNVDLVDMFPADESKRDKAKVASWTWDFYLKTAEQLHKGGFPVGCTMGQTSDAIDMVGAVFRSYGSVFVDEKDNIKVDSAETRTALEYFAKLMQFNAPDAYAWDDAGNNRWLISGKGSSIFNPPSAWAVAVRDNPEAGKQCWTHDVPSGPKGRFAPYLPFFYGVWNFGGNKTAAKELVHHMVDKPQAKRLVAASRGYDLPSFKTYYDFDTRKTVEPPLGTVYNYPPRGDEQLSMAGYPARPDVAAQIYNNAVQTVMVSKIAQGKEKIEDVIKWAKGELEGYLRT